MFQSNRALHFCLQNMKSKNNCESSLCLSMLLFNIRLVSIILRLDNIPTLAIQFNIAIFDNSIVRRLRTVAVS